MPFKRRLRLLFVSRDPALAQLGVALTRQLAPERIEPRSAPDSAAIDAAWPDLVLTLDEAAAQALPRLPARVQVRHLALVGTSDGGTRRSALEARLRSIVGGLDLLARSEKED